MWATSLGDCLHWFWRMLIRFQIRTGLIFVVKSRSWLISMWSESIRNRWGWVSAISHMTIFFGKWVKSRAWLIFDILWVNSNPSSESELIGVIWLIIRILLESLLTHYFHKWVPCTGLMKDAPKWVKWLSKVFTTWLIFSVNGSKVELDSFLTSCESIPICWEWVRTYLSNLTHYSDYTWVTSDSLLS